MLYGSYCPLLMEHIKKGMMNREGKKQWDVSTTLREAVYECLGEVLFHNLPLYFPCSVVLRLSYCWYTFAAMGEEHITRTLVIHVDV